MKLAPKKQFLWKMKTYKQHKQTKKQGGGKKRKLTIQRA